MPELLREGMRGFTLKCRSGFGSIRLGNERERREAAICESRTLRNEAVHHIHR